MEPIPPLDVKPFLPNPGSGGDPSIQLSGVNNVSFSRDQPSSDRTNDGDYRLMIDAVTDYAIFMLDPAGFIQNWNAGAKILKGYEAEEVIGRHFSIFYPLELQDRNWTDHELAVAKETGKYQEEGWRVRKDGSRFWASVVITKLVDAEGRFRGFSKITRDLSERRRQDEMLRSSEERFRLLVEGVSDYAIFMLDPAGYIVSWNRGAQFSKGYTADEIIGQHFSVFYPPDVANSGWPETELANALKIGRFEDEGWRVRKDGSRFWANVIITPLHDEQGRHRGFAKITRDLTEKRRVDVLEDERRRITAFIAMLAHELRNPLAPISNAVAVLDMLPGLDNNVRKVRDIVARQSQHLKRLVDDLLDISRISEGKIHIEAKPVRLDDVITDALEMTESFVREQRHNLSVERCNEPVWVMGDKARLTQIVSNLLHNAAKFTPAGGSIRVGLAVEEDGTAAITVADNGVGINPDRLPQLFSRFEQRENDSSKTFGGLGLGLSLAQALAQLQRGIVTAFSTGIAGEGSIFSLRLPRADAPLLTVEPQAAGAAKTILVVDDNRDSAFVVAMLLETMGFQCRTVHSGARAVEEVKRERPGVVLLDIGLPDIDGYAVARQIATEVVNPPPLIAVTGYGLDKDRERSFKAGFHAHVTKPVDPDKLLLMLKSILTD